MEYRRRLLGHSNFAGPKFGTRAPGQAISPAIAGRKPRIGANPSTGDRHGSDVDGGFELTVAGMEVGWWVIVEEHPNQDPVEHGGSTTGPGFEHGPRMGDDTQRGITRSLALLPRKQTASED